MVANGTVVVRLSDLVDGQEAVCYAALVKKTRGMTKSNQPFVKCYFRDKRVQYEAPLWHDHRFFAGGRGLGRGHGLPPSASAKHDLRYGLQIDILGIRPAADDDARRWLRLFRSRREQ